MDGRMFNDLPTPDKVIKFVFAVLAVTLVIGCAVGAGVCWLVMR